MNPALFCSVVLDRTYKLRYGGAAKQRMGDLHRRGAGYTLADLMSESPDVVNAAVFAWAWCCIASDNPWESPAAFREKAEECGEEAVATMADTVIQAIKNGLPRSDEAKNHTAGNAPSPALNSA